MIVADIRLHPLPEQKILLVGSILLINIVIAHKCYVCGPNNVDLNVESDGIAIASCSYFNSNMSIYVRQCTSEAKGCSFQTNGTVITRTCEMFSFNDCKTANNVEYCYCNTDLCNKVHPTRVDEIDPDDTDDDEGSGTDQDSVIVFTGTSVQQRPTTTDTTPFSSTPTITTPHSSNSIIQNPVNIITLLTIHFVCKLFCDIFLYDK